MFCIKCGQQIADGSTFCAICGAPQAVPAPQPVYQQPVQPQYQQPMYQPIPQQPLTRNAFFKLCLSKKSNTNVICLAVIFFITAVISVPLMMMMEGDNIVAFALMDISVYTLFGILLLAVRHWLCALIPTIYSGVWTVVGLINGGTPTGFVALAVGIIVVSTLFKAEKAYQTYQTTGVMPATQI